MALQAYIVTSGPWLSGQPIMFGIHDASWVVSTYNPSFLCDVWVNKIPYAGATITGGTFAKKIATLKVTPNNKGKGYFDFGPLLESQTEYQENGVWQYLGETGSTIEVQSKRHGIGFSGEEPHPIHHIDIACGNENSYWYVNFNFYKQGAASAIAPVEIDRTDELWSFTQAKQMILFPGAWNREMGLSSNNVMGGTYSIFWDKATNGKHNWIHDGPTTGEALSNAGVLEDNEGVGTGIIQNIGRRDYQTITCHNYLKSFVPYGGQFSAYGLISFFAFDFYTNEADFLASTNPVTVYPTLNITNAIPPTGTYANITAYDLKTQDARNICTTLGIGPANMLQDTSVNTTQLDVTYYGYEVKIYGKDLGPPSANYQVVKGYKFRLVDEPCEGYEVIRLAFINEIGHWDYYNFTKKNTRTLSNNKSTFQQIKGTWNTNHYRHEDWSGGKKSFGDNKEVLKIKLNTDWVSEKERDFLKVLFRSPLVHMLEPYKSTYTVNSMSITGPYCKSVYLDTKTMVQKTKANDRLFQYSFDIEVNR